MCKFLSVIVRKSGEILCDPEHTDSHEDLLQANGVRDWICSQGMFCRVEFTPPEDHSQVGDVSKWELKVDEESTPEWFDHADVRARLSTIVEGMFISTKKDFLLGGCWILLDGAVVEKCKNVVIKAMYDSSQVGEMCGSSQVGTMYDSSQVGTMRDSSQVGEMCGSSQVGTMYDSSQVGAMRDSSQVGEMCGSSQVGTMCGSSQVGEMCGSSQVGEMCGSSQVGTMYDSSQVGTMYDSSQVGTMRDSSQVVGDNRDK